MVEIKDVPEGMKPISVPDWLYWRMQYWGCKWDAEPIRDLHLALDKLGVRHFYYESPGTGHEWLTWRRSLRQFAPMLFR